MNIVNLLSLLWALFTWGLLQLVELPEDELNSIREKKKHSDFASESESGSGKLMLRKMDTLSEAQKMTGKLMQSTDRFDNISILNLKMNKESRKSLRKQD